jgi:hypothetical protein
MNINEFESQIDSERFGVKTAKINKPELLTLSTLELLKANNFQLVISRIPSENIDLLNFLEENKFRIKDIQLTYKFDLQKQEINYGYLNNEIIVRQGNSNDIEQLTQIAEDCFWNYGHYFADKNLNQSDCMEVYKDWTVNAMLNTKVADKVLVAEFENKILGYLFFKLKVIEEGTYSYSGLGAVSSNNRGRNVFSTLAIKGLEWAKAEGHLWQEHNVLNINYPVNKVFSKLGFFNYKSETTLHAWL